ncbi:MAG TPA: tetratricopeptide repeat protein, partial [Stellaceae bacterium]|nr:tetratricopeptide repeat protein [Stellaceae bacterium]
DRPAEAEAAYRQALGLKPGFVDAQANLAILLMLDNRLDEAVEACRDLVASRPDDALAHYGLGDVLQKLDRPDEAAACYETVIRLRPDLAEAHNNLGTLRLAAGRLAEAEECCRTALALRPDFPEAHNNLASALRLMDRLPEAEASYRMALRLTPDMSEAHDNLGNVLRDLGRLDEAVDSYHTALQLDPESAEAHNNLGAALNDLGRFDQAAEACRTALRLIPTMPVAHNNLGNVLRDLGRLDEAVESYRMALRLDPESVEAHSNLGAALHDLGHFAQAADSCRAALRLKPRYPDALLNLSNAQQALHQLDEAAVSCRAAIDLKPDFAEAHHNLSLALLLAGHFGQGWSEYEWRWHLRGHGLSRARPFTQPLWTGEALGDRILLIHGEQGYGDVIQFCRYATLAAARGRVVLEVPARLVRLLAGLPGVERIVAEGDPLPPFDLHCPMLSLPRAFGTVLDTIPARNRYLSADPMRVAEWRQRVVRLPGLRVGLVWAGSARQQAALLQPIDRRRSVALAQLAPLAAVEGVSFVSLQKEPGQKDASAPFPPAGMVLHDWMDELSDFADTAALVEALDLVISVDTAMAHLAGALGKPVWLLNRFDTCWRWLLGRDDSPWYPTLRQFRQPRPGDWDSVLDEVRVALAQAVIGGPGA